MQGERISDGEGAEMQPEFDQAMAEEVAPDGGVVPCEFLCGSAGCGKTFEIKRRIEADPSYGILSASTGIAAVNLSAVTINSLLGYFDSDGLRDNYLTGRLTTALHKLALEFRWLVIDEVSMIDGLQLDLIYRGLQQANDYADIKSPMGIVLVGDFAQLPPVKAKFAFEAECWEHFDAHTTRLTRIWRQDQQEFLQALNFARRGQGGPAAEVLSSVGVRWETALDTDYDGTTLVPKNDQVDRFNQLKLDGHKGAKFTVSSRRWGQQRSEWKSIPFNLILKEGCYVMILSNAKIDDETGKFPWVNGDCGHVESVGTYSLDIRLVRTGAVVSVPKLVRSVAVKDKPERWDSTLRQDGWYAGEHRDGKGKYVIGQVEYYPVRLAYASTVHKSQGLSLDKLQVDIRNSFFSHPGMLYVALSRCRTLEGLRIVGQRERFVMHCKADERIQRWL
jgi:ATP-dependent DNA helicase PIF1